MKQPPPDPDVQLHLGILAGDAGALEAWEAKYRDAMIGRATRKGLPAVDAENAFEDAFHQTMIRAKHLTPIGPSLRQVAYTVLARRIADYYRAHGAARDVSLESEEEAGRQTASLVSPSSDEGTELSDELTKCLQQLTKEQRQVVQLLLIEELSTELVAERLGIAPNSVTKAKGRALKALEQCLQASHG